MQSDNFNQAVNELRTVKSIEQWNEVRSKYLFTLTQTELAYIDGSGLIVQVLGKDK